MASRYERDFSKGLVGTYAEVAAALLPHSKILEIGCHSGDFTAYLSNLGHEVTGIESDAAAVQRAKQKGIEVIHLDVERIQASLAAHHQFDVILAMDVLEHLKEPSDVLRTLHPYLHPRGRLIVTGPNVAHWAVRKNLLLGRWEYTETGIMDRTHLRFYTRSTWRRLLQDGGFRVIRMEPVDGSVPLGWLGVRMGLGTRLIDAGRSIMRRLVPDLFTIGFLMIAVPDMQNSISAWRAAYR